MMRRGTTMEDCYAVLPGLLDLEPTAGVGDYGADSERQEPENRH